MSAGESGIVDNRLPFDLGLLSTLLSRILRVEGDAGRTLPPGGRILVRLFWRLWPMVVPRCSICWATFGGDCVRGIVADKGVVGIAGISRFSTTSDIEAEAFPVLPSPVSNGLNSAGVSGNSWVTSVLPSSGLVGVSESAREPTVILYVVPSFESRTTLMGLGALPDRARLKILLRGGGARRSDPADPNDAELWALVGDGA